MGRLRRLIDSLRTRAAALKRDLAAVSLACRDSRTPWYAKLVAVCVVAYALSPIDLIPDFIPVIGYLDDLILIPAGIALAIRLIPRNVFEASRAEADRVIASGGGVAAAVIVVVWLAIAAAVVRAVWSILVD